MSCGVVGSGADDVCGELLARLRGDIDHALKHHEQLLKEQLLAQAQSLRRSGQESQHTNSVDAPQVGADPARGGGADTAPLREVAQNTSRTASHPFSACDDAPDVPNVATEPRTPEWHNQSASGWLGNLAIDKKKPGSQQSSGVIISRTSAESFIEGTDKMFRAVFGGKEARPAADSAWKRFTTRWEYETLCAVCIVADAFVIRLETETASAWAKAHPTEAASGIKDDITCIVLSDLLTVFFILDLVIRVKADGYDMSMRAGGGWRWFDIAVVITCLLQGVAHHALRDKRCASNFRAVIAHISVLRIIRLFQIASVSPAVRTHEFFHELRIMIFSLTSAIMSFFWSAVMLFVVFVIFGTFFVEGMLAYCVQNDKMTAQSTEELRDMFGTLLKAILTLNQSITGGNSWGDVYDDLNNTGHLYGKLFLVFIAFAIVALLNVVTAVFVGSTIQKVQNDRNMVVASEMSAKKDFLTNMQTVFNEIDLDGSGEIGYHELRTQMQVPSVGAYFSSIGVDVNQFDRLFGLLDTNCSGTIDLDEFMFGCLRLSGSATSLDQAQMEADIKTISARLTQVHTLLKETALAQAPIIQRTSDHAELAPGRETAENDPCDVGPPTWC